MKILYLTEFLTSIGGGGAASFSRCAVAMADRGHRVHVICHKSRTDTLAVNNCQELLIHRIDPEVDIAHGSFPTIADQISYAIGMIRLGRRIIRSERIDVIHANTLNPTIAGAILSSLHNIPLVNTIHHIHSTQVSRIRHHQPRRSKNQVFRSLDFLTRMAYERTIVMLPAARIHCVSNSTLADLRQFGCRSKTVVIPNGLELGKYDKITTGTEYRPYLVFIGRLVDYKNLDIVIESFVSISKLVPNARLVVLGDGPMRKSWQERARKLDLDARIEFRGYVGEKEKLDLLGNCSGLVFPSLVEGFGMVIIEAFAMAKPVLVSDISSLRELVKDGVNGFVIDPYSIEDWATRILSIITSPSISRAMGGRGRKLVEDYYTMDRVAGMLEYVYRDIHSSGIIGAEKIQIVGN